MSRSRRSRQRPAEPLQAADLSWLKMDLHIHTPGSLDYQEDGVSFVQILQRAEARGIDILGFTDHNTVRGYARMWREIEDLELLEALGRLQPEEAQLLTEYRRLLNRVLVLPGFEFTATFGFHILAVFPEDTSIRRLEHLLLALGIPEEKLDKGTSEVGATTDVLQTYEILHEAGAIVIGAHVNSTHGIAMQGFPFGGQTKIAYTQSPNLHALEATDLDNETRRSTARFFNGTKPEYPRRMHILQGSDAHRLARDPERETNLGVGDRMTEVLLPEASFKALKALLEGDEFSRARPYRATETPFDFVLSARTEGNNIVQSFHERLANRRTKASPVLKDIAAFANTNGGTVFIGLSTRPDAEITGVAKPEETAEALKADIARFITPPPTLTVEIHPIDDKSILVLTVPQGKDKPYALVGGEIFVRQESETTPAMRDEIVQMVRASLTGDTGREPRPAPTGEEPSAAASSNGSTNGVEPSSHRSTALPRTGVEIVDTEVRDDVTYHAMRDLRNRKVIRNVTKDSARRLWRYAISQLETSPIDPEKIQWSGPVGFIKLHKQRDGAVRYDLAYRDNGNLRIFYGVTDEGIPDDWRPLIPAAAS
ncbi:MAG TPA: RNA-binding domain-containing protein [Thermomicrobiaceae bacterium]|nr:RNA-binding domain-containing protein [Thermomicrobiaceae bacterium]